MTAEKENRKYKDSLFIDLFYQDETAKKLVQIPVPEFYTFYNGTEEFPKEKILCLSDAFIKSSGKKSLELKVKIININTEKKHEILEKCGVLKEYSLFIDAVRKHSGGESAIKKAVNECIEKGILSDYLKRKGSEVRNMLVAEYSYERDMQVKREEAREDGIQEGIQEGIFLSGKIFRTMKQHSEFTDEQIAKEVGCTVTDVKNVRKTLYF